MRISLLKSDETETDDFVNALAGKREKNEKVSFRNLKQLEIKTTLTTKLVKPEKVQTFEQFRHFFAF
ncbi:MAG: hypothetical protein WCM93_05080 [Bacteroidota bacterium]